MLEFIFLSFTFIYCLINNFNGNIDYSTIDLWILPFLNLICFSIISFTTRDTSVYSFKVIKILCLIKYSFTIFLYYSNQNFIDFYNKNMILLLMIIEMIAIYVTTAIFYNKDANVGENYKNNSQSELSSFKFLGISAFIGLVLTIFIILKQPQLLKSFLSINENVSVEINGFEYLIYKASLIIFMIFLLKYVWIKLKIKSNKIKILLSLVLILVFSMNISSSFGGNISRWTLLINILIFTRFLISYYKEQKNFLIKTVAISLIILLPLATFLKFDKDETNELTLSNIFKNAGDTVNFRSFDAYFSGPYQMSVAIKTKVQFGEYISINTLINDIFNNFPLINHYLDTSNTIPSYYNYAYHGTTKIYDKICPLIGQAYIYLGWFLSFIFPALFIYIACYCDSKIKKETNEIKIYMLSYISIFFSLCFCLNLTIMFQSIWLEILPLFLIYSTNIRITKNSTKKLGD